MDDKGDPGRVRDAMARHPRLTTLYGIIVALLCLFVPWQVSYRDLGYSFIASPPSEVGFVAWPRVLLELVAVTALYAITLFWREQRR